MAGVHAFMASGGLGEATINITTRTVSKSFAGFAAASWVAQNDGNVVNHASTVLEQWCNPPELAALYEIRATFQSGDTVPSSNISYNTWMPLSISRYWTVSNDLEDNSTKQGVVLIEIRLASTGVVKDSATITIRATSTDGGGGQAVVTL